MNLKPWVKYFKEHGVFTSSTSGNIEDWVHPGMFSFFQRQPQDSVYNQVHSCVRHSSDHPQNTHALPLSALHRAAHLHLSHSRTSAC